MQFVQPKPITLSNGVVSKPKIQTIREGTQIRTEAYWYCPVSGRFIKKGVVSIEDSKK